MTITDEALMLAVRDGDVDSAGVLFDRYHRALFAYFYRMLGNRAAADDLVQEVFVRLLKYRHSYRGDGSFGAWLFCTARNARHEYLKKYPTIDTLPDDFDAAAPDQGPATRLEHQEDAALLRAALRRLPPDKRELIVLARCRGLTHRELADILDAEVGTIRVRLHRALRQLDQILCALGGSAPCTAKTSATR